MKNKLTLKNIIKKYKYREPGVIGKYKFFSVLVPFIEVKGELNLLYEVRGRVVSQPGETCFPGGHVEAGESPKECAVRETEEETGIDRKHIHLIGPGDILPGYANYTLYTFLAIIDEEAIKTIRPQDGEVEEVFLMPVDKIMNTEPIVFRELVRTEVNDDFPFETVGIDKNYDWRVGTWEIPIYEFDNRVIWGLTARITMHILDQLNEEN